MLASLENDNMVGAKAEAAAAENMALFVYRVCSEKFGDSTQECGPWPTCSWTCLHKTWFLDSRGSGCMSKYVFKCYIRDIWSEWTNTVNILISTLKKTVSPTAHHWTVCIVCDLCVFVHFCAASLTSHACWDHSRLTGQHPAHPGRGNPQVKTVQSGHTEAEQCIDMSCFTITQKHANGLPIYSSSCWKQIGSVFWGVCSDCQSKRLQGLLVLVPIKEFRLSH